jgi:formylglycine-generating enzyme required for sulfatase activity
MVDAGGRTAMVPKWTGREVRALREARRMSVREFAAHLGVSDRMVSKWEAGGVGIRPRPVNQAALDTSLGQAGPEVRARFASMSAGQSSRVLRQRFGGDGEATHLVRHPEDGKVMTLVEPGQFPYGQQGVATWLPGFYVDVRPTTNAEYARFVAATGHPAPPSWPGGSCPPGLAPHPVVTVSWADVSAYAHWSAKALPTPAQWEKAARGPSGSPYPWGDHVGVARANLRESRVGATTPVDRYDEGMSVYGVYDLCGNVWEWTQGAGPQRRELRGGSYRTPLHQAAVFRGVDAAEDLKRPDIGFRCVLSVPAMLELLSI